MIIINLLFIIFTIVIPIVISVVCAVRIGENRIQKFGVALVFAVPIFFAGAFVFKLLVQILGIADLLRYNISLAFALFDLMFLTPILSGIIALFFINKSK